MSPIYRIVTEIGIDYLQLSTEKECEPKAIIGPVHSS